MGPNWGTVPRTFGNPRQFMVFDYEYLMHCVNESNGKYPVFISHNSFPKIDRFGIPETVLMNKIFKDLDNEEKPENALLDLRKLTRLAIKENIPHAGSYSGGKGFHFYHLMKEEEYEITPELETAIRSVQLWWCGLGKWDEKRQEYEMQLRNDDIHVYGDWRRLCRVWGSRYVKWIPSTKKSIVKDTHCIPLTDEMILEWSYPDIVEFSKNPGKIDMKYDGDYLTLKEFINKFKVKEVNYLTKPLDGSDGKIVDFTDVEDEYMRKLFVDDCLYNQVVSDNPTHESRFAIVVYLKDCVKMTQDQILNFFVTRKWVDSHNVQVSKYQINHIFKKDYHRPKNRDKICRWMRKNNLCVGKVCKFFKEAKP